MDTFDFNDGNGPVPAHKHPNGGGWVADTACVAVTAYVAETACVFGNAKVFDNVSVYTNACVYGNAQIYDDVIIHCDACVYDNALVYGRAQIYDNACVFDNAVVCRDTTICGSVYVYKDLVLKKTPYRAVRSDNLDFIIALDSRDVPRIVTECWYFTIDEARDHCVNVLKESPLREETLMIIYFLQKCLEIDDIYT